MVDAMGNRTVKCAAALIAATLAGSGSVWAATGQKAGVAGAVRGNVALAAAATARRAVGKKVETGDPIFLRDRITTSSRSGLQIMLLDRTTFTIGPEAEMVIDKFVYDPSKQSGSMSARIVKGTFRFVSGAIARRTPEAVTIKLPAATIGIRGTTVIGSTNGRDALAILSGPGRNNNAGLTASRIIITAAGKTVAVFRSGYGVFVPRIGAPPGTPRRYSLRQLGRLLNELNAQPLARQAGPIPLPHRGANRPPSQLNQLNPASGKQDPTTAPGDTDLGSFAERFTGQNQAKGLGFLRGPSAIGAFLRSVRGNSSNPGTGLAIGKTLNPGRGVRRRCRGKCNGKP